MNDRSFKTWGVIVAIVACAAIWCPACAPQPCITRVDRIHFANACLAPCHQIQDKPYEYREPPPHHSEWINEFRAAYVTKTCPDDE